MELYEKINDELNYVFKDNFNIDFGHILYYDVISEELLGDIINYNGFDFSMSHNDICANISRYQELSEDFIDKYAEKLNWGDILANQVLSDNFLRNHIKYINWQLVSEYQVLSEDFMEEFSDKINWSLISMYQKLSENFMRKMVSFLDFTNICIFQKLSEEFIEEFSYKINWYLVSMYQKLSSKFIIRHTNEVSWFSIILYQRSTDDLKLHSESLVPKYLYNETQINEYFKFKAKYLQSLGKYECHDDYFIAYKAIRKDRYSLFNFQYKYEKGGIYESWCDCTDEENSFGLSVGTFDYVKKYLGTRKGMIVRCKVRYEDIGRVLHDGEKVRCFKIEILD